MNSLSLTCLITTAFAFLIPVAVISARDHGRYAGKLTIVSKQSPGDFVPDGDLSKTVWRGANSVRFDEDALGRKKHPEAETRVSSVWTAGYVYCAFRCKYTDLNVYNGEPGDKEKWGLWDRDVVEAFINPAPERFNHYYEFEVSPNNLWIDLEIDLDKKPFNDAAWDSRFEHATRVDEPNHVWTCEMKIPAGAIAAPSIKPGAEWRINFYRADGKGDDSQRRFLSWSPLPGSKLTFHQPASFSIIRFEK